MFLVTGGAGFIGSNVVAGLNEAGHTDIAVNDLIGRDDGKWRNLAKRQIADVVPPAELAAWLAGRKLEAVIHMGAITDTTATDGDAMMETNFRLSLRLLDWCAANRTPFIYASSAATYGDGAQGFDDDWSREGLHKLKPMNLYAASKHLFDQAVADRHARKADLPPHWAGLKFFNVFGPNEYHKGKMMSVLARVFDDAKAGKPVRLFKSHRADVEDGDQRRDFIYVDDAVALVRWLLNATGVNGIFNAGTGEARSFHDMITAMFAALGRAPNIEYIDMPENIRGQYQYFTQAETANLRRAGYNAGFTPLEEAVAGYVTGYLTAQIAIIERLRPQMFDFEKDLSALPQQTVLCIGDLMLDDFVYGEVERISPEAPTPVIAVKRNELMIGGAGNVARNVVSLGARCILVGVVGDDDAGRALTKAFAREPMIEPYLVVEAGRPTTRKVRFVSEHHSTHLLRADWEVAHPVKTESEDALIAQAIAALKRAGVVMLSDYAKGVLTQRVIRAVIDAANKAGKPVVVDPKGRDYSIYRGATLITPNRHELAEATHQAANSDSEIAAAARTLREAVSAKAVLVTRSESGMTLVAEGDAVHIPAYPVRVRDVSGAGDTVAAVLALMAAMHTDFEAAMRAANAAAAVVVGKRGTATLSAHELRARILPAASLAPEEKILFDWALLDERIGEWRRQGLRIGFTNGCFDLLHPGHIKVLAGARAACDRLVVGLNGDASVKRLKGEDRPLQEVHSRAEVLAALEAVDLVVVFDEDTPEKLIARVKPKVLVKGGDYKREEVVGRDIVEAQGGEVILIDLVPGHSTSAMVKRSRATRAR